MTQEYTPVAWQDETTSQQGTLINAERLNQMQTAHHYADGLEEVDAIPTADPGVSYHKIVYCTADSTIYRWDGTEWTADIDDETKRLLEQEIARATEAEGELAQDIADEETARETADSAMQADISALGDAIEAEETARGQADTALGTRITNETSARETADTGLGNRITAEATARAEADTALGGRIDTEQARAEAAEQANAQAIANTYTKAETDALLALKADQATTYTKAETDALLASKANDNAVVKLTGNQNIAGVKTFIADIHIKKNDPQYSYLVQEDSILRTETPSAVHRFGVRVADKNGSDKADIAIWNRTDGGLYLVFEGFPLINGTPTYKRADIIKYEPDGTGYMTGPSRGYNAGSAYSNDLATIGTLDAYTPMVRTTGNQEIHGQKSIFDKQYGNLPALAPSGTNTSAYVKIADLGVSSETADLFINFGFAERYSCGYAHFNYVTNTSITSSSKIATTDVQNITVGIFEETNGHAWLVTKRLASGANRCIIYGMLTMRGTAEIIPILNTDGTTFTDTDGTYYEGVRI